LFTLFYTPQASTPEAPFFQHFFGGLCVQVRPPAVKLEERDTAEMQYFSFLYV